MAPLESDGVEIVDLSDMPPLEDDEEEVKSGLKETIAERAKLNPRRKTGTGIKILTPNKLPVLLAQIKAIHIN